MHDEERDIPPKGSSFVRMERSTDAESMRQLKFVSNVKRVATERPDRNSLNSSSLNHSETEKVRGITVSSQRCERSRASADSPHQQNSFNIFENLAPAILNGSLTLHLGFREMKESFFHLTVRKRRLDCNNLWEGAKSIVCFGKSKIPHRVNVHAR